MSDLENKKNPVVITIARDFGAEGHEIGRMLADELGIPLYDNELLVRASLRAGESLDKMAAYDERLAVENMAFLPDRYDARSYSDKLFQKMSQVILDLGETESCIIEGRLSDYLLRNNPNHIAVLVTAPFEDRVEIVRKKRGLNKKKGAKLVKQQQKAREAFYKRYSAGKWKMTSGKDIVVNRAKLGREGCKDVIAAAYRKAKAQADLPKEQMVNYVKDIYAPFTDDEIAAKMVELLKPESVRAKVQIVYQPLEGLHEACPNHPGDWYFSGNYPTPGGVKLLNKAFIDYIEQVYQF